LLKAKSFLSEVLLRITNRIRELVDLNVGEFNVAIFQLIKLNINNFDFVLNAV